MKQPIISSEEAKRWEVSRPQKLVERWMISELELSHTWPMEP